MDCLLVHAQGWQAQAQASDCVGQRGLARGSRDLSDSVYSYFLMQLVVFEWELLNSPGRLNNMPKVKQFQSRS